MQIQQVSYLGLHFSVSSLAQAIEEILAPAVLPFRYVVTPNVHHIVRMDEVGESLKSKYAAAWRIYCDSRVLSMLARICGIRLSVITGSDLTAGLIEKASELKMKIAIVGPSTTDCMLLQRLYPGLDIRSHTPPMGFVSSEIEMQKCVDFLVSSGASLSFLAVGMPQQEILAQRLAEHPEARGVGLCVGASIDFLTHKQRRAPKWVQQTGCEWLHRLLSDPRRLARRYLIECPRIFPMVLNHMIAMRFR